MSVSTTRRGEIELDTPAGDDETQTGPDPVTVPLSYSIAALTLVLVLVTGGLATAISVMAGNRAVSETESEYEVAVRQCFDSGRDNVMLLAANMLHMASSELTNLLSAQFSSVEAYTATLLKFLTMHGDISKQYLNQTVREVMYSYYTAAASKSLTQSIVMVASNRHLPFNEAFKGGYSEELFLDRLRIVGYIEHPGTVQRSFEDFHMYLGVECNLGPKGKLELGDLGAGVQLGTPDEFGQVIVLNPDDPYSTKGCNLTAPYLTNGKVPSGRCDVPESLKHLTPAMQEAWSTPPMEIRWSGVEAHANFVSLSAYASFEGGPNVATWPLLGKRTGIVYNGVDVSRASKYMKMVGSKLHRNTRMYAVEIREKGGEREAILFGASHGETTHEKFACADDCNDWLFGLSSKGEVRAWHPPEVSLSAINLRSSGYHVLVTGVHCSGCNTSLTQALVDGKPGTFWVGDARNPLYLTLSGETTVDAFTFTTSPLSPATDPVGWVLEGSLDNQTWYRLYSTGDEAAVPTARSFRMPWISLPQTGHKFRHIRFVFTRIRVDGPVDPIVRTHAEYIRSQGGYAEVAKLEQERRPLLWNDGNVEYIYGVAPFNRTGREMYLVTIVKQAELLQVIRDSNSAVESEIKRSQEKVEEQRSSDFRNTIFVLVGCMVVLMLLSALLAKEATGSLVTLTRSIDSIAKMKLDRIHRNDDKVQIREVHTIEEAFASMVLQLKELRSYIPQSVLEGCSTPQESLVIAPQSGEVTLVFTDIVESTVLWEVSPDAMNTALDMHNSLIRELVAKYSGYEVKTIGDSFMLAFEEVLNAGRFIIDLMNEMAREAWPRELGLKKGQGLLLRIGAHQGTVASEENPLTGRTDYRGRAVNKAARAERRALPGTACITADMMEQLRPYFADLGCPCVYDLGKCALKGIAEPVPLFLMVPAKFEERIQASGRTSPVWTPSAMEKYRLVNDGSGPDVVVYGEKEDSPRKPSTAVITMGSMMKEDVQSNRPPSPEPSHLESPRTSPANSTLHPNHTVTRTSWGQSGNTGIGLRISELTIAVVNVCNADLANSEGGRVLTAFNSAIRAVAEAATQTDGTLDLVFGRSLVVTWNTVRSTSNHITSALRFISQLASPQVLSVGICTGPMFHGNVGSIRQRFHIAIGKPLMIASSMADMARELKTHALLADYSGHNRVPQDAFARKVVRPIDSWKDIDSTRVMTVYQVLKDRLDNKADDWGKLDECDDGYWGTFDGALHGKTEAKLELAALSSRHPTDKVLAYVAEYLGKVTPPTPPPDHIPSPPTVDPNQEHPAPPPLPPPLPRPPSSESVGTIPFSLPYAHVSASLPLEQVPTNGTSSLSATQKGPCRCLVRFTLLPTLQIIS